jgi:KaiC/GvpD/RAD55 family RecA-like ATPase
MFEQPLSFVRNPGHDKHIVLFHEEPEYARMILFEYLKAGLKKGEHCSYFTEEEDMEFLLREMRDSGINVDKYAERKHLLNIHYIPNLIEDSKRQTQKITEIMSTELPNRAVFKCIYKVNTPNSIASNIKWEHKYRFNEFRNLICSLVCTYPVYDITTTISDSTSIYGRWMSGLLKTYDAVIFARKLWKGVAFNLSSS